MQVSPFAKEHSFQFHRSPVTALAFLDEATRLVSTSADTYIILYDLIASVAEFKLLGHSEPLTQIYSLAMRHPVRGTPVRSLISSAKDGLLKVWSLEQQQCIGSFSEENLSKIADFCLIAELGLLVACGAADN